ncbi:MAG: GNAT family N-acetyltransferase [Candidatus Nitrosopumilus sp. bin_6a]
MKKNDYLFKNYQLIPIRLQDAEEIRRWRNEQINFLRQEKPLSSSEQIKYFEQVIVPTFQKSNPTQILFSFLNNSKIIGYGGFVNIDWNSKISEISFLEETDRTKNHSLYEDDFSVFLDFLKKIACNDLKFTKLFTETYDIRPEHIKILEKNGFSINNIEKNGKIIDGKRVDILFHSYICNNYDNL